MNVSVERIGPEQARVYLRSNIRKNRKLTDLHLCFLAEQMKLGKWYSNGDSIRFDSDGCLIDGQHRLNAIIKSKTTQEFVVVRDLSEEAFVTIDTGTKVRSIADHLSIIGVNYSIAVGSALALMAQYENNRLSHIKKIPVKRLMEMYYKNRGISDGTKILSKKNVKNIMKGSIVLLIYYYFSKVNKSAAEYFFEILETGMTRDGMVNAVTVLRDQLYKIKMSKNSNYKINRGYELAIAIKAWNKFVEAKTPRYYMFDTVREKGYPKISTNINPDLLALLDSGKYSK